MSLHPKMETILGSDASINVIESYILPPAPSIHPTIIQIGWKTCPVTILKAFSRYPQQSMDLKEYHYRDLVYSFDLSSDQQKLVCRRLKNEATTPTRYTIGIFEDVLPSHRYPCSTETTHDSVVSKTSYKINNRIQLIHDVIDGTSHVLYIRYQHSPNVDMTKMQSDFDRAVSLT